MTKPPPRPAGSFALGITIGLLISAMWVVSTWPSEPRVVDYTPFSPKPQPGAHVEPRGPCADEVCPVAVIAELPGLPFWEWRVDGEPVELSLPRIRDLLIGEVDMPHGAGWSLVACETAGEVTRGRDGCILVDVGGLDISLNRALVAPSSDTESEAMIAAQRGG